MIPVSGGDGGRSIAGPKTNETQSKFIRQAMILRKNLYEWNRMLLSSTGEDWPTMVGRLNAALNQAGSLDDCVEDLLEHFVYVPKKSTTNPQDVPVFLSSRLAAPAGDETKKKSQVQEEAIEVIDRMGQPVAHLNQYESHSRDLVVEFETSLVRF